MNVVMLVIKTVTHIYVSKYISISQSKITMAGEILKWDVHRVIKCVNH